jgi:RimJ/RimL family protein N-acetyltransferase
MIIAETPRLILRPFEEKDIADFFKIVSDPKNMSFWPQPFDIEKAEGWVRRSIENFSQTQLSRFALIAKESGEMIGDCGFIRLSVNEKDEWDLGYIIDKNHWGKGFATEAASAAFTYGKNKGLKRIVASMAVDHLASRKVAEKIGMKLECEFVNSRNRNLRTFLLAWQLAGQ